MKSLAYDLLKVVRAILGDLLLAYPHMAKDIARDSKRLTRMVEHRGLVTFTLDLPALDTILLDGLSSGRAKPNGHFCKKWKKGSTMPSFLKGLWSRVFDVDTMCLIEEPDPTAIAFLRQIFCLGKKIEVGCSPERYYKTIKEYRSVESEIRRPTLCWDNDYLDVDVNFSDIHLNDAIGLDSWYHEPILWHDYSVVQSISNRTSTNALLTRLQQNADCLAECLGEFVPDRFFESIKVESRGIGFRHGPGAVSDRKSNVSKYIPMNWSDKLQTTFTFEYWGKLPSDTRLRRNHEVPSKLIAVPKTAKSPRLIAAESTENQWCQQFTKRFLEERLTGLLGDNFIAFKDQNLSRSMVLSGSLDQSIATVDLSSASDRLSCWVVERIFRKNPSLLQALHASRTRYLRNDLNGHEGVDFLKFKKFASQGTAVTFPVQTIVFWLCAITASGFLARSPQDMICNRFYQGKLSRYKRHIRVFGDDIIIPNDRYASLCDLLTVLGLKVNDEKSFNTGNFRESCGMDAFMGYDVTPCKPKSLSATGPTARASLIDLSNNLFLKGYWRASREVESLLGKYVKYLPIVDPAVGVTGRISFCGTSLSHLNTRWNGVLHRREVKVLSIRSRTIRKPTGDLSSVIQYFAEAPSPLTKWENGTPGRPKTSDSLRWEFPWYA